MNRRSFLQLFATGLAATASGVLIPELLKPEPKRWFVGANLRGDGSLFNINAEGYDKLWTGQRIGSSDLTFETPVMLAGEHGFSYYPPGVVIRLYTDQRVRDSQGRVIEVPSRSYRITKILGS